MIGWEDRFLCQSLNWLGRCRCNDFDVSSRKLNPIITNYNLSFFVVIETTFVQSENTSAVEKCMLHLCISDLTDLAVVC